ncbi:uncharacterized protein Z520_07747 [Fonsecaea multimorphosa CBS 102226]|uniref:L-ornithine N(5)-oxygenase n=1 Tax=Fonsecaea multimorphosa CBS 102226 TaxID=1442371 RepID=A0A0D2IHI2_9EURO|nr:uncharacterized protein Z520_07747 [Fonsecaea multimorphosa CBS 102226]KIX96481.1 hypothetical protein Z520_07747 [Fonsecaea multimorphosa CBS 102226]OAL28318.1 hypothetical protein AYO22_03024 [Fonsecaea multimorphosa]
MDDRGHTGELKVAIIGAGFSGLSVAHYIRKYLGLQSFVIYEKSEFTNGGAGTWKDNTYPGCACDVPIHLYQLSWARQADWTEYLPLQPEIQEYLNKTAKDHGFVRHIQFGTELLEARWIDAESVWELKLRNVLARDPENAVYSVKHNVLIMCTGPLSQPKLPANVNVETYQGEQFHSQQWRSDISLENKRVAVVGNGCSATQFMPIIARRTKQLTQYVSSPQWYVPRDNPLYSDSARFFFRHVPGLEYLYRLSLAYAWEKEAYKLKAGDGPAKVRSTVEGFLLQYMKATAPAKYHENLTPKYPLGCKRLVFDSNYFAGLHADNVDLAFTRVSGLHENGIIGQDGSKRDFDVIIWATGFTATMPFQSSKIYSRGGKEIHSLWEKRGAPSAYKGMMYPDFPNFFMTTGPNTLSGHYSVTTIIEIQAQYIAQVLKSQLDNHVKSFEVTKGAHDEYNQWIRDRMKGRVWTSSLCNSWFKTKDGLIPTNFPGTTTTYWKKTFYPNFHHFRQVGGTKTVHGTSIQKEVIKMVLKTVVILSLLCYLGKRRSSIQAYTGLGLQQLQSFLQDSLSTVKSVLVHIS